MPFALFMTTTELLVIAPRVAQSVLYHHHTGHHFSLLLILYSLFVLIRTIDDLPPYHLRHVMLNEFLKGTNGALTAANINDVYGQGTTSTRVCQLWFHRFRSGNKSVEDEPRSSRPTTFDESKRLQLVNEDNWQTTRELAEALSVSHAQWNII